jgi:poly(hydroxyalkanoate) depolymerase family esterase
MKFVAILIVLFGTAASLSATQTTTTTSLTSSLNPSIYGQAVTFTAMVSSTAGAPPDGESVTFTQGKNVLGTSPLKHGTATYKISTLAAGGVDTIKAMYSGDSNFAVSTSVAVSQVVNKASTTTTLTTGQNPSNYGQSVTLTATVTGEFGGTPTGNVLFYNGSTKLATVALSGAVANYTTATLAAGTDSLTAVYNGSTSFTGSTSSPVSQVVNQATTSTTMISSLNPSKAGQSVTFTATIAPQFGGTVTGTVTFYNGSAILKTATVSGGAAKLTTATLPTGTDTIMATYSGNADFTGSSASVNQVVNAKSVGVHIDSTMTWDAVTRYYDIYLPANMPANPPMLLMLHGTKYTSTFDPQAIITLNWGWQPIADKYGFIVVTPASTWNPNTTQWNWNAYFMDAAFAPGEGGTCTEPPASGCPDDAGFLRQLIVNLTAQYNVNANMVYVTGMSSGAQMTERVGVEISDLVAAIAPASGQMEGQEAPPPPVLTPGNAVAPISVQEWHGTLDKNLWPCGYGTTKYSGVTFTLDTVDDTFNYWTGPSANACTVFQTTQTLCTNGVPTPGLTGNDATGCANNVEVQFIWEQNVAHSWQNGNDTARWLFFASHPKP